MIGNASLLDHLASALPAGLKLRVYHLSTPKTPSSALFSAAPGLTEEATLCESHFLGIAAPKDDGVRDEILAYAIEVLVFTTTRLTTVFVSKADSSGFLHLLKIPSGTASIIRIITTRFLDFIISTRITGPRLVLSLFARSQNQYLFPGSIENVEKHVLDDRQLIKWWCRTLDPIVRGQRPGDLGEVAPSATAHVLVPGLDKGETRAFFPATVRQDSADQVKWISSYPVQELTEHFSLPLRCLIPRLPDDPKARFLTDLDTEYVNDQGQWRTIRTLDQFWEMLSYRQECSAGRLVGFVWVVFERPQITPTSGDGMADHNSSGLDVEKSILPTPKHSQTRDGAAPSLATDNKDDLAPLTLPESPPSSSPLCSLLPVSAAETSTIPGYQDRIESVNTINHLQRAEEGRGELIISADDYEVLMECLLELDFAGQKQAIDNTRKWTTKAGELARMATWGRDLEGRCTVAQPAISPATSNGQPTGVNILMGVRKKRKAEVVDASPQKATAADSSTNGTPAVGLSSGLVRKKPKA